MVHFARFPDTQQLGPKRLSVKPTVHHTAMLRDTDLGAWTDIGPGCSIVESRIDDYTYLAGDAQVIYSDIGKYCSIATGVRINPGNHPMDRVTQHHMTYRRMDYGLDTRDDAEFFQWRRDHRCVVGHDVWIGHGATIMPGVKIGTGAVIGSGAVVTRDLEPYTIAVGVPARPMRKRFDETTIARILASAWWDWDRATLEARWRELLDTRAFVRGVSVEPAAVAG